MKPKFIIFAILSILIIVFAMFILIQRLILLGRSGDQVLTAEGQALVDVRKLLDVVVSHSRGDMPRDTDTIPSYLWVGDDCWSLLQERMASNNNKFQLDVNDFYNPLSLPYPVKYDEQVTINVVFPDGHVVEVLYYKGGLAGCREGKLVGSSGFP